jgi:hypothetical protein
LTRRRKPLPTTPTIFEVFEFTQNLRFGNIGSQVLNVENLLDFADIPPIEVDVLLSEVLLAERFRRYFSRAGEEASRQSAEALLDFPYASRRDPHGLARPREEWVECYCEFAEPTGASADLDEEYADVAALLDPILSGEVERGTWDPGERRWKIS